MDTPQSVSWAAITEQAVAAGGPGTVVSLAGSGDSWTVVVSGADGSQTQSVVSATLGRVTSGPFPKQIDAADQAANVARAAALKVGAAAAADKAVAAVPGSSLSTLVLSGTGAAPTWTASVSVSGTTKSVSVDGVSGAAIAG